MFTKFEIEEKIMNQLAVEFNCKAQDFDKSENVITSASLNPKRRKFSDKFFFLSQNNMNQNKVTLLAFKNPSAELLVSGMDFPVH